MTDTPHASQTEQEARATAGPLAQIVLRYSDLIAATVAAAKQPSFDPATGWAEIEALLDVPNFVRYGAFREVTGWADYRDLLTQWATSTDFWCLFRRISEAGDRVFWEVEEHNTPRGGTEGVVNSMSAFQFNPQGKICRLDIYLQSEAMLTAHANWGDG